MLLPMASWQKWGSLLVLHFSWLEYVFTVGQLGQFSKIQNWARNFLFFAGI